MTAIYHGQKHYLCIYIDHASFSLFIGLVECLQQEELGLEVSKALWYVLGLLLKFAGAIDNLFTIVKERNNVGDQADNDQRFSPRHGYWCIRAVRTAAHRPSRLCCA